MSDEQLAREAVEDQTVFAKLSPAHKERIIRALAEGRIMWSASWATGSTMRLP